MTAPQSPSNRSCTGRQFFFPGTFEIADADVRGDCRFEEEKCSPDLSEFDCGRLLDFA
jgi:hypothetical protein